MASRVAKSLNMESPSMSEPRDPSGNWSWSAEGWSMNRFWAELGSGQVGLLPSTACKPTEAARLNNGLKPGLGKVEKFCPEKSLVVGVDAFKPLEKPNALSLIE